MFESMTQQEAKEKILALTAEYYQRYCQPAPYHSGDRIPYAGRVYDQKEMQNLIDSSLEFWLTSGRYTAQFEKQLAEFLHIREALFVNSGSSANLLAFMALTSPLLKERAVCRGDEVITVACGFPTTVSAILQFGAVPVFVDVTIPQYNIDVSLLEQARSPRTKAVMLAHTLGNPFSIREVKTFCDKYHLWLIEDNCDALGSVYTLDGESRYTGTFGDIGTSSFYPPHHLTTGEGGAVYTNNALLAKIMRSMRDWGRDCVCRSGQDNLCGHRFDGQYGELPAGYDHKYIYSHFGYNLKATDLQAAIGCGQLEKFPLFAQKRRENFVTLRKNLEDLQDYFILPEACPDSDPCWFGFPLTCRENISRNDVVRYLEQHGIQTRMLFAGNLVKHPCFDTLRQSGEGFRIAGTLDVTDQIMNQTFWIGVYPGMTGLMLEDMAKCLYQAVEVAT